MSTDQESPAAEREDIRRAARSTVQLMCLAVGAAFVALGILGFIPGVTSHYSGHRGMRFSGVHSSAELFHVFRVSMLHNAIHLALGLIGLVSSFNVASARWYLGGSGVVCIALAVYGWSIPRDTSTNVIPVSGADNWLHLLMGLVILIAAVLVVLAEGRGYARARRQQ